jgi:integrase
MSAGLRLTARTITSLTPEPGAQYVRWDAQIKGFGVRVSPSGTKTYLLKYRLHTGRVRWKMLGRVGDVKLGKARRLAQDDLGAVARGGDPLRDKDAARAALTVADVGDRFLLEHVEARRKPATLRLYTLAFGHIRKTLGRIPIADVTTEDAIRLHHKLKATPYLANRVLAVLSKLLAWSASSKYRAVGPNPCAGIEKYPEQSRRRYLDDQEYARLGRALRTITMSPGPRTAIELLLLTGCRPQEIATLQWAHVNLPGAILDLPDSKTGAKVVHLSPPAVKLLKKWPRVLESAYVFPGAGRVKSPHMHATTLAHAWAELRTAAQLENVRLYDACRHSYASVAVSQHGLSLAAIGEQLGHSQPATTQRYAHLHDSVARENATSIGSTIATALKRRVRR